MWKYNNINTDDRAGYRIWRLTERKFCIISFADKVCTFIRQQNVPLLVFFVVVVVAKTHSEITLLIILKFRLFNYLERDSFYVLGNIYQC